MIQNSQRERTDGPVNQFRAPEPLDLVWTSSISMTSTIPSWVLQMCSSDEAIFDALKPGGVFLVVDHVAQPDRKSYTAHCIA